MPSKQNLKEFQYLKDWQCCYDNKPLIFMDRPISSVRSHQMGTPRVGVVEPLVSLTSVRDLAAEGVLSIYASTV